MVSTVVTFLLLAAVIVVAASFLARFADALGERLGFERTITGVVLLAVATSLPELVVSCQAARINAVDLAVGDLLGSCLFNLLILAVLDLMARDRGRMFSRAAAAHALSAASSIALCAIVIMFMVVHVPWPVTRIGPGSVAIVFGYLLCLRLIYFDQHFSRALSDEKAATTPEPTKSIWKPALGYLTTTLIIFGVGPQLAETADHLAMVSGLGGTFVGTVFVAFATSLPEVTTTREAIRMGAHDLAVGNIFGSNAFNIFALPIVDLFVDGDILHTIAPIHALTAGSVILVTAVAMMGLLYRSEKRYWLVEPDAGLVILLVLGTLGLIYIA